MEYIFYQLKIETQIPIYTNEYQNCIHQFILNYKMKVLEKMEEILFLKTKISQEFIKPWEETSYSLYSFT